MYVIVSLYVAGISEHGCVVLIPLSWHDNDNKVQSSQHNLKSEETYVALQVPDVTAASTKHVPLLRCEHFAKYGEKGHELSYFRGNANIPCAIWTRSGLVAT